MAGADNVKFTANVGLSAPAVDTAGAAEADLWYNTTQGRAKLSVGAAIATLGNGTHPLVYNIVNQWYPLVQGIGANLSGNTTVNRAYAYPFQPGRKCSLLGFATPVDAGGVGANARMALYTSHPTTGLPDALIADYGTQAVATVGTKSGWTVNTVTAPALHWIVFISQDAVTNIGRNTTFSPWVPWIIGTPTFGANDYVNCLYSDTGFSGAAPATFGVPAGSTLGPTIYIKLI